MTKNTFKQILFVTLLSGCATERVADNGAPALHSNDPMLAQQTAPALASSADPHAAYVAPTPAPAAASHAHAAPVGVAPEQALKWLQNGNKRYIKNRRRNDGLSVADRARLSNGQKPHTIVLSCSDSRVPPEHVFDQALGEIFVIRVAGEALDSSVIASIEYAVEHLGSRLLLVMGHESCGAVKAALTTPKGQTAGSTSLDRLVADIQPRVAHTHSRYPAGQHSPNVLQESGANARGVANDLAIRSPILKSAVGSGKIQIKSAIYHMKSGQVEFFN